MFSGVELGFPENRLKISEVLLFFSKISSMFPGNATKKNLDTRMCARKISEISKDQCSYLQVAQIEQIWRQKI